MQELQPKLIVFASGSESGGGSGFENLITSSELDADIVAVVSNYERGGVREIADRLGVPFVYFHGPYTAENYQKIIKKTKAEWTALSGWLKKVNGLDPAKTFNIHPALLSQLGGRFGGKGMWGHHVHGAVKEALDAGEIAESGITMHFVSEQYDRGPIFFEHHVPLTKDMPTDEIAKIVNEAEHKWQPQITNKVIHGKIAYQDFVS